MAVNTSMVPGGHPEGWLVGFLGNAGVHLGDLPSIARLGILCLALLVLGAIPATHTFALWAGVCILGLSIVYGV